MDFGDLFDKGISSSSSSILRHCSRRFFVLLPSSSRPGVNEGAPALACYFIPGIVARASSEFFACSVSSQRISSEIFRRSCVFFSLWEVFFISFVSSRCCVGIGSSGHRSQGGAWQLNRYSATFFTSLRECSEKGEVGKVEDRMW